MASIVVETNVPIPLRDGTRLFADNLNQGSADLRW
jgi:hypothetical protein